MLRPVGSQGFHEPGMSDADSSQKNLQQLRRESRPTLSENQVVGIFNVQAGGTMQYIERTQQFLNVQQAHVPGEILRRECGLQSIRGTAMPSTGVVKNNRQFAQEAPDAALPQTRSAGNVFVFGIFWKCELCHCGIG